ncbi:Bug family tripartite tricarboxylate transporter substrate binding protein [Bordetella sp. 2513F-2]
MKRITRSTIASLCTTMACLGLAALAPAQAADWPTKPVRVIVPFTPGGTVDLIGRTLADKMGMNLGKPVVVENKGGASAMIGTAAAVHAAPDGHTLLIGSTTSISIRPQMAPPVGFDVHKDLIPITQAAYVPHVILVNPRVPATNMKELVAWGTANGTEVTFGDGGTGTPHHLSTHIMAKGFHTAFLPVSYKGGGEVLNDLIAGHVNAASVELSVSTPHMLSGALRPIAIAASQRDAKWPDLPTVAEQGIPGYETTSWFGVFTTAGTPPDVVSQITEQVRKVFNDPEIQAKLADVGLTTVGGTQEEFITHIDRESKKWASAIQLAGIAHEAK